MTENHLNSVSSEEDEKKYSKGIDMENITKHDLMTK